MKVESWKIGFVVANVLLLCSLHVVGQEPTDSVSVSPVFVNDTIDFPTMIMTQDTVIMTQDTVIMTQDTVILRDFVESDVIFISDTTDFATLLPVESMEAYFQHSPAKAAMMSAVLPGLGQIYNKKYIKLPFVYAALGISVHYFVKYNNMYNQYRRAYIDLNDGDPNTNYHNVLLPTLIDMPQQAQLIDRNRNTLRTWRDWAIVAVVAAYALNIIDANVDAHMMDFSLDDNISLNILPTFFDNNLISQKIGLTLRLSF